MSGKSFYLSQIDNPIMYEVSKQLSLLKEEYSLKIRASYSNENNYDKKGFISKILKYHKP